MAYIVKRKNREGKEYVYLIESFREDGKGKKRTLKSYGSYEELERNEPGAYERLRKEAKEGLLTDEIGRKLSVTYELDSPLYDEDLSYGWKLLDDVFDMLRIGDAIKENSKDKKKALVYERVLKLLVYQRILNPGSKIYTARSQKELFGSWDLSSNDIYRSLEPLSQLKEAIQLRAHEEISKNIGRLGYLVFYDVTNYYFDIDFNDEDLVDKTTGEISSGLRKKGPCKSNSGNPIVQMGLFMDSNGIPISYRLFSGNETDPLTYLPAIKQVKRQFGLERVVVVADKAMNSKKNVGANHANKDGWLFSQKHRGRRGSPKDIQDFILKEDGWLYNKTMDFAWKSMIRVRALEDGLEVKEKVLVTWNEKYALREKKRRDGALDYASKLTNAELFRQTAKRGGKRYLELFYEDPITKELRPFSPVIKINEDQLAFDEQFDGINVLVTSELDMSEEEIMAAYSELYRIEECFRITKTDLHAKPVHLRLKDHIESHFLSCFISLMIIRIIQTLGGDGFDFSAARLARALGSAGAHELNTGFYRVKGNEDFKELVEKLGIDWNKGIVKYEELRDFSKGWCTTVKSQQIIALGL